MAAAPGRRAAWTRQKRRGFGGRKADLLKKWMRHMEEVILHRTQGQRVATRSRAESYMASSLDSRAAALFRDLEPCSHTAGGFAVTQPVHHH